VRGGVNIIHHFPRGQRTTGDIRNPLGRIWGDRRQEIIVVGADCKVVGRHKERRAIGSAIENVCDPDRTKLTQKIWDVAGGYLRENFNFALLKIQ